MNMSVNIAENVNTVSALTQDMFISKITGQTSFNNNKWSTELLIENEINIKIKVDCGADVSIINYKQFNQISKTPKLTKCNVKYKAYNNTAIPVHGKCMLQVESQKGIYIMF